MHRLKILGKNVHLNIAEMQILHHLMEGAGLTESEALEQVMSYIREQAMMYEQQQNFKLAEHLLKSIDEWDDSRAQQHANQTRIFVPDE